MQRTSTSSLPLAVLFAISILLSGCSSTDFVHTESSLFGLLGKSSHHTRRDWVISEKAVIMVAPFPKSDAKETTRIQNQRWLIEELEKSFSQIIASSSAGSISHQLNLAGANHAHYLIVPSVTDQEDQLNGVPELLDNPKPEQIGADSIAVKILLYDVYARSLIDATLIEQRGPYIQLNNESPNPLIREAFQIYASRLNATPHLQ